MAPSLKSIRFHPWYSVSVVAWLAFCHPGMFSALNGLGASGEESAGLSNTVNAVTFGALTVGGFFTGIICNYIGFRWTLVIGTLGYAPYAAALYTNAAFGNTWFPILGGLTCGVSGVHLWTATGAVNLVLPPVSQRGRAVATKFTLQNFGGFIGGILAFGLNASGSVKGRVSDATYFTFMSIMCLGLPAALTVPRPEQVVRSDGSKIASHKFQSLREEFRGLKKMLSSSNFLLLLPFFLYCQWDLSYMWTWNAVYHSVRARGLLSAFFYLIGPTIIGPIQGYLLDKTSWSRRKRARIGSVLFAITSALIWIFGLVVQYQYDHRDLTVAIDIVDPVFAKSFLLFVLYGLLENSSMVVMYWILGSLGLSAGEVASLVGLAVGLGSAGSTAAFIIGAKNVALVWQLWANVITFLIGIPGLLYVAWFRVVEDTVVDAVTSKRLENEPSLSEEKSRNSIETNLVPGVGADVIVSGLVRHSKELTEPKVTSVKY
ncbi:Notoamide biosynthesis cluster protein O' [Exophiala dermatitidis]|uniref:MFS general substrate transporter n=1 Tax=Exophiala dermatitidis (strain ATCC 34100 / CBS 525.76 / NIH/UT8656) TaxID=858893 RepID=H6C9A2_EXODN|nr:uncharacterized protein HMPREF1120_07844 [Exophiala dermatitidis NIH/UT8656]EHY59864.1 hypothetical protein HMPREF1120_07844 [Exophiala dermatitidis NIH/UT8656]